MIDQTHVMQKECRLLSLLLINYYSIYALILIRTKSNNNK